jgi:hypothetical protein
LKERSKLLVFVALVLALPSVALSQWIDEGEFSRAMLAQKLRQLNSRFEQAEAELLMRGGAGSKLKNKKLELEDVYSRIRRLEAVSNVFDMFIKQSIYLAAILAWRIAETEQVPDFF